MPIVAAAYNPCMFHSRCRRWSQAAVVERLTLLINHVLAAEPVAIERLQRRMRPHAC